MYNTALGIIEIDIDIIHCMILAYDLVRKLGHKTKVRKTCKYLLTCAFKIEGI